ncbi:MAG: FAD-dependent oxidoreductase [Chlamydiae bacterium]|nr:FAD-dependent oxidoreductase [Chlamydiota bacterium]
MDRGKMLKKLSSSKPWDVIIIGGGATGLGAAVDAASRGYRTLLLEQSDFAKGTSSRSTKLIHGGLRYLQQGDVFLVIEALRERGLLCKNAPHLVHHLPFLLPLYHWWEAPFYGIGLKIYDLLAGKLGIESSKSLSKEQTLRAIPTLEPEGLRGGLIYYDGQFDDSRLAITLAGTAASQGGVLLNYMPVVHFIHKDGMIKGVKAKDLESGETYKIYGKTVINATGVFTDQIRRLDNPKEKKIVKPSQGIHIVLPKSFLPSNKAIIIPSTDDGRVVFMVPWHDRILVGTTDTAVRKVELEPHFMEKEVSFLLEYAGKYLTKNPTKDDVLSVYAGLRPLIKSGKATKTAALSRDHAILIDPSGLITIAGGKWTTYRKMGEDVINKAAIIGDLPDTPCVTKTLPLFGWDKTLKPTETLSVYGSELKKLKMLMRKNKKLLHPNLPYYEAQVLFAVRFEMARTVEDVLSRRTRALLLDAKASVEAAPLVASIMAKELGFDSSWEKKQVIAYKKIAANYILT